MSSTIDRDCHIQCDGDKNVACGGFQGVSLYGQGSFEIVILSQTIVVLFLF